MNLPGILICTETNFHQVELAWLATWICGWYELIHRYSFFTVQSGVIAVITNQIITEDISALTLSATSKWSTDET